MHLARKSIFVLAFGLAGASCSDSDSPTSIEIPIADVQIRSGVCAIPEGATCTMIAEAKTADGTLVLNPVLRWDSNNTTVAVVVGEGSSVVVHARSIGSATITVSNSSGDASDTERVSVLPCSKC